MASREVNKVARLLAALAVLALLAAGCGDDGGDAETSDTTTTASATTSEAPSNDTSTTAAETTTTEPVERTASFRGVTEDTIRVGVLGFDWDRLADLGVSFGVSNSIDLVEAALESINDGGGIHGRQLELHSELFLPVGPDEADAACVSLTDDHQVFLVVGTARDDQILCFTEINETAAIVTGGMNAERIARARAPYAALLAPQEERAASFVSRMEETGVLDGATVGVTGSVDVSEANFRAVASALTDAGYDPVEALIGGNADDLAATARDQNLVYQRMTEAGVDVTVSTTGVPLEMFNAVEAGYETEQWLLSTTMTGRGLRDAGVPWSYLDGALGVSNTAIGTSEQPAMADDPAIAGCIDDLVARTDHEVFYELDVEVNDIGTALSACALAIIIEQALFNAGPNPTNETLQAGLEAIGELDLPGYLDASLGPGDLGAVKGLRLVEFDAEAGVWNITG